MEWVFRTGGWKILFNYKLEAFGIKIAEPMNDMDYAMDFNTEEKCYFSIAIGVLTIHSTNFVFLPEMISLGAEK